MLIIYIKKLKFSNLFKYLFPLFKNKINEIAINNYNNRK